MPIEHIHPEGEPVPTVRELADMKLGLAFATDWDKDGKPTRFRLTTDGYDYLGEIMRRNAEGTLARGSAGAEGIASMQRSREEGGKDGRKST